MEAARQLVREHDVGEFGLVVGALSRVAASALQVIELDPAHRLRAGGDGNDPSGCAGLEPIHKQVGEEKRSEVVEGEGALQAVGSRVSVGPEAADIVDQHVQTRVSLEDNGGELTQLVLGGHVGGERVNSRVSRGRTDVGRRLFGARRVATRDPDPGAEGRKAGCSGLADSPGAAGNHDDLATHRKRANHGPRLGYEVATLIGSPR